MSDARGAVTGETGTAPPRPIGEDPPRRVSEDVHGGADQRAPDEVPPGAGATPDDAPEAPLDASAHAHVLEDPLPPPGLVDTAETPLFADTLPMYAHLGDPVRGRPGVPAVPLPPATGLPTFAAALAPTNPPGTSGPDRHAHVGRPSTPPRRRRGLRGAVAVMLVLVLLGLAALATYLYQSAQGWRDRAGSYLDTSLELGDELASTRSQLSGSQAELEAVRAQLATTHQRIVELADEKNQALDDWEITQQLVNYQQRVSDAAGQVALALDQCVQGQQEYIGYLQASAEPGGPVYDPTVLAQFEADVEALCQAASEANISLQRELAR